MENSEPIKKLKALRESSNKRASKYYHDVTRVKKRKKKLTKQAKLENSEAVEKLKALRESSNKRVSNYNYEVRRAKKRKKKMTKQNVQRGNKRISTARLARVGRRKIKPKKVSERFKKRK